MSYGPYSYSRIATHLKCPAKFYHSYVIKTPRQGMESAAMARGTLIHKSVEDFMCGKCEQLHPDIHATYGQFFLQLRENYVFTPEAPFSFNRDFEPVPWKSEEAWVRGYFDLKLLPKEGSEGNPIVYEFKTGGIYDEHEVQRRYYGAAVLIEGHDKVDVGTIYFDKQDYVSRTYTRANDLPSLKYDIREHIGAIEADQYFIAKPSFSCRWCPFSRHNGGPCAF